jgi:hypothetical protein
MADITTELFRRFTGGGVARGLSRLSSFMPVGLRYGLLGLLMLFFGLVQFAQQSTSAERQGLEARQRRIRDQIAVNQRLLNESKRSREHSMAEIKLLKQSD